MTLNLKDRHIKPLEENNLTIIEIKDTDESKKSLLPQKTETLTSLSPKESSAKIIIALRSNKILPLIKQTRITLPTLII